MVSKHSLLQGNFIQQFEIKKKKKKDIFSNLLPSLKPMDIL